MFHIKLLTKARTAESESQLVPPLTPAMHAPSLLLVLLLAAPALAFKPVILMHGVGSGAGEMATIKSMLETEHKGTVVSNLALYEGSPGSWDHPLKTQVAGVTDAIRKIVAANASLYKDGYNLVCKSQGGLTCRCVLESMDDHNVDTFISLAGPQAGVYGKDFFAAFEKKIPWLEPYTADALWLVAYTSLAQSLISVANIWRDPNHLSSYAKGDVFLHGYTSGATPAMKVERVRERARERRERERK